MINAKEFVSAAQQYGYEFYAGVPCSFLTSFINHVIDDSSLNYISAANEGDAVAAAAGAYLGSGTPAIAMMQNSGLGNAISPLASLTHTFKIPVLLIVTLRGEPGLSDEPQHELMGQITGSLLDELKIPWSYFPDQAEDIDKVMQAAHHHIETSRTPYALIMKKGSISPGAKLQAGQIGKKSTASDAIKHVKNLSNTQLSRSQVLQRIIQSTPLDKTVILATTGFTGRELYALDDRKNHLYMVGSMGCISSLGLGLSISRPDLQVIIIDGDGAALMRMGNFATIGSYAGNNLVHILLDNEVHDSTGSQATVSSNLSFSEIAKACGYSYIVEGDELQVLDDLFAATNEQRINGPFFATMKTTPGAMESLPRPSSTPQEVGERFMQHIRRG